MILLLQRGDVSWRVRTNAEMDEVVETKAHWFRWLDHLERMAENPNVKRAYLGWLTGRRPADRPKYRYSDQFNKLLTKQSFLCRRGRKTCLLGKQMFRYRF